MEERQFLAFVVKKYPLQRVSKYITSFLHFIKIKWLYMQNSVSWC